MAIGSDLPARRAALLARLVEAAPHLGVRLDADLTATEALDVIARSVRESDDLHRMWLLHVAITATLPTPGDLGRLRRHLILATPATALLQVLAGTIDAGSRTFSGLRTLRVVTGEVLVDVDFCARWEHNTGIQRVVRHTVPHWQDDPRRAHRLVAWTQDSSAYVDLTERQADRVLHWSDRRFDKKTDPRVSDEELDTAEIVVPWNCTVVIAEVPAEAVCAELACLAQSSPNRVALVGYDTIPLASADTLPDAESERFAKYLTVVKHSDVVAGISESASDEFRGFVDALPSQGLTGPDVVAIPLATEVSDAARRAVQAAPEPFVDASPIILCVGSHEPRKNQDAVLFAAELLFREGLDFRIVFVGGGSRQATIRFDRRVAALQKEGMRVESHRRLGDDDLWTFYSQARFSVFASLHEGFGLPVAESLALGTPVLTSDFGSLDEVAAQGGCVQIDPRDDEQIVDGMRRLLQDDALLGRLHDEIRGATWKSWQTYADELWDVVAQDPQSAIAETREVSA
ncbi:glycosyltransferase family 1 protein [Frondihabitans peucedani]|uniref:Glycosyl transferase family 1 domain-containing protein n=1 Tax=Frondihabitans peucedani TaxID=598626 RepID=A0ABP8DZJ6_9MICO